MRRILFVGEGVTDVGDAKTASALWLSGDASDGEARAEREPRGVVPILVLRSLRETSQQKVRVERCSSYLRRLHGRSFARKIRVAMIDAVWMGADGIVIVVDRGGRKNSARLDEMRRGKESAEKDRVRVPAALGIAIEELEAWLLADEQAIAQVLGTRGTGSHPDPEGIKDPKARLKQAYHTDGAHREDWERHEAVAEALSLGVLRKRCPKGFQPFYAEVTQVLGPVSGAGHHP